MNNETPISACIICGQKQQQLLQAEDGTCRPCQIVLDTIRNHPERIRTLWLQHRNEAILPNPERKLIDSEAELPDVLDGTRYRTVDRDRNKWYLSVSEVEGKPVEVFASTAFDRDHELQSRISNLTTITRLISLILRHISLGEPLTFAKCLKQIQRSSRQKNDLPDMLYGVLSRYNPSRELDP